MRILLKIILVLIGFGLMGGGAWGVAVGFAYNNGKDHFAARYEVPRGQELVRLTRKYIRVIPKDYREHLKVSEHGMTYPLGAGGGLILFAGLIFLLNGFFRLKGDSGPARQATAPVISDDIIRSMRQDVPAEEGEDGQSAETISIDDSALDGQEESLSEKLRDIGFLVQMSQGELDMETVPGVVQMFRPDLAKYLNLFEGRSSYQLAIQIINSVILRHHRTKEDTTADQFKAQDVRLNESENSTFARRYTPAKQKITTDEMRATVGKVYDLPDQAAMQKKFAGEVDDWTDMSLRNAKDVLAVKTALEV